MEKLFFIDYKKLDDADLFKIDNPILRVLRRYSLYISDYENNELTEAIFIRLGWSNRYKDTIFSFFRTICVVLEFYSKICKCKLNNGAEMIFYHDNNSLKYKIDNIEKDRYQYKKSLLYEKATEEGQTLKKVMDNIFRDNLIFPLLKEIAELTDSLSNFTPHPGYPFNQAKGLSNDVLDSLNLMVDKIQACVDEGKELQYGNEPNKIVKLEQLKEWHSWFKNNQSVYCLDGFYEITDDGNLKGVKLFENQSLNNVFPKDKKEIIQYLQNMKELLYKRGKAMNKSIR
ncbi:MAG: hypothetical protein GYA02_05490 [Clostridiaceae bacterium]|nr:hypothetical protein [Clostridiaceae bacterium]